MNKETSRQLNFLASAGPWANTTMSQEDAREMLLETGGNILARGRLYDFVLADLGAGVYRVSLTPTHP